MTKFVILPGTDKRSIKVAVDEIYGFEEIPNQYNSGVCTKLFTKQGAFNVMLPMNAIEERIVVVNSDNLSSSLKR
jgi:hypothetical protein